MQVGKNLKPYSLHLITCCVALPGALIYNVYLVLLQLVTYILPLASFNKGIGLYARGIEQSAHRGGTYLFPL